MSADQAKTISIQIIVSNVNVSSFNQQSEKANYKIGENACNHMSDKELIPRIFKELHLNNKKPNNAIKDGHRTWIDILFSKRWYRNGQEA